MLSVMSGSAPLPSHVEQLEAFQKQDAARYTFIAEIVQKYEELQVKYQEKCDDYNNEVESRRMWQSKASSSERALTEQKQVSGSNSFVLCVLDGDGTIFQDYLYNMGRDGGAEAAHQLHAEIKKNLKLTHPDAPVDDWNVVVQIILNLQGLATKLQACGIVMSPNEVLAFGRAFGHAQPLFSFIDVGQGKERADHKIRETLRLFLPNAQCKHVFFGPCHDNGYIVVLESYKRDYASKLTLVETRPAESGFLELGLRTVRFPRIFRSENLPSKTPNGVQPNSIQTSGAVMNGIVSPTPVASPMRSASGQLQANCVPFVPPVPPPNIPQSVSPAPSSDSGASSTWATVGKSGTSAKTINITPKKPAIRRFALLNVYDERVDADLPRTDASAEKRFNERLKANGKFCNNFHLLGKCEAGEYCDYNHGERLSPGEQLVLKHKARSRTCPKKAYCRDIDCTFGHHCKYGQKCYLPDCWFYETHGIDTTPAKKMYEDGTEEWIQAYLNSLRA